MAVEPKEWIKARYRSNKVKTGSIHVSVNSETLRYAGVPKGVNLLVRVYPLNKGKVLLKFKEVKEYNCYKCKKRLTCKKAKTKNAYGCKEIKKE